MDYQEYRIPAQRVRSLVWHEHALIDWAAGGHRYQLDGTCKQSSVGYAYRFDAALQSASGAWVVIYERLGTKGVLLHHGKIVREINRSFYYADAYEYPVAFLQHPDGRELLGHCPRYRHMLEIEDLATGECLTNAVQREPSDFFHSRLTISPKQTWFLSAGWVWHPIDSLGLYQLDQALADPQILDYRNVDLASDVEINTASFIDDQTLLLVTGELLDWEGQIEDSPFYNLGKQCLARYNLTTNHIDSIVKAEEKVGLIMPLDQQYVLGFYDHPKLFDCTTGKVIQRWPELTTGKQISSIMHHLEAVPPPMAFDPINRRFAVADATGITVIELKY
ncbi:hypothetical protein [Herpetosiphon gulosus]|uniref:Uncharacterized protein n=1 Tax=Herpetosiphon gulosus TaxID=1973496 RepID=A0ABP9X7X4_9CHLR